MLRISLLLLLLLVRGAWAQAPYGLWTATSRGLVQIEVQETGRPAGEILQLHLTNPGKQTIPVVIPVGTVFVPKDSAQQARMCTEEKRCELPPRGATTIPILGVCLEYGRPAPPAGPAAGPYTFFHPRDPQGQVPPNRFREGLSQCENIIESVKSLTKAGLLHTDLGSRHAITVCQRAVWAHLEKDGPTPHTREKLKEDIQKQVAATNGTQTEEQINKLTENVWADVDLVLKDSTQKQPPPLVLRQDDYVADHPPECHRCQGGRLIIVIGNYDDGVIKASYNWGRYHVWANQELYKDRNGKPALRQRNHLHVMRIPADAKGPKMGKPEQVLTEVKKVVFNNAHGERQEGARASTKWSDAPKNDLTSEDLVGFLPADCCYFDEVMVMFHGHQKGVYEALIEKLPYLLNGKPMRKLVLWSCKSGDQFYPKQLPTDPPGVYEKLLGSVYVSECPCKCPACRAKDANGADARCPKKEGLTVITSGFVENKGVEVPVPVGIDFEKYEETSTTLDGTLTSPDGRVRKITVKTDGSITAEMTEAGNPYGYEVFGKIRVGKTKGRTDLVIPKKARRLLNPSQLDLPAEGPAYVPPPQGCDKGRGCQPCEADF